MSNHLLLMTVTDITVKIQYTGVLVQRRTFTRRYTFLFGT